MRRLLVIALLAAGCTKPAPATSQAPAPTAGAPAPAESDSPTAAVAAVSIDPAEPVSGQVLQAKVVDPQDRALTFAWLVDGAEVSGESGDRLPGANVKKGQSIKVRVVPVSDKGEGEAKESEAVKVVNSSPRIDSIDFVSSDNGTVILQTRASDPDEEKLAYRLVKGPAGMEVDGEGRVRFTLPADFAAPVSFVVGASDGADEATMQGDIGQR
jgi:hypothetical protein